MTDMRPARSLLIGVLGGVVGSVVMGMFAMIAAATYQETGFFTPLYHIASSLIEPTAMEASMKEAMNGNLWHFTAGPALAGAGIHMMVGAFWGAIFGLGAVAVRLSRAGAPVVGIVYGLGVMVAMAFVGLPLVASLFGGGAPVRDMAEMVGWSTFAAEHAIFGLILGAIWAFAAPIARHQLIAERRQGVHA